MQLQITALHAPITTHRNMQLQIPALHAPITTHRTMQLQNPALHAPITTHRTMQLQNPALHVPISTHRTMQLQILALKFIHALAYSMFDGRSKLIRPSAPDRRSRSSTDAVLVRSTLPPLTTQPLLRPIFSITSTIGCGS